MTDKERAVIDVARLIDGWVPNAIIKGGEFCFACDRSVVDGHEEYCPFGRLEKAFDALDAEQENDMEYNWLAIDEDGDCWHGDGFEWDGQMYVSTGDCYRVEDPPSFLKPGQLWEREERTLHREGFKLQTQGVGTSKTYKHVWRGYWWRLVEDHSQTESFTCTSCNQTYAGAARDGKCTRCAGEDGWITDTWKAEAGKEYLVTAVGRKTYVTPAIYDHGQLFFFHDSFEDNSAQVIAFMEMPKAYTPPKEPKCEECTYFDHGAYCGMDGCEIAKKLNPIYGMDGCKFKRRGE